MASYQWPNSMKDEAFLLDIVGKWEHLLWTVYIEYLSLGLLYVSKLNRCPNIN